ncbi:MAG: glycosyltransferase [Thermodesulfobacteriaceae bacterium]|nr:glycosyltransferase [Thermodesulfobacteriaceae bacterium]
MKIALVHDWLTGMRGGEKVLEAICELFPHADLYTLLHIKGSVASTIEKRKIFTSFLQHLPDIEQKYRYYLPLMPQAIERFDLSEYDVVISSSHCVAKGVKVKDKTLHICYCHTPMRYVWDMYPVYFEKASIYVKILMKILRKYLQKWDLKSSKRVNHFIANSENVRKRIQRHYHREAKVIYPPVDTDFFVPSNSGVKSKSYYLIVSAFAPYKKIDLAIEAFNYLKYPLKIIGTGQEEKKLKKIAKKNIEFLGWVSKEELREHYQNCKALIFPGEEDFGIVAVEAQACGTPVIAYGRGGITETVIPIQDRPDTPTGVFFYEQTPLALIEAVKKFETLEEKFDPYKIRKNAERFSKERFKIEFKKFVDEKIKVFFELD